MSDLQYPICKKCGRMLEDTDKGYIIITSSPSGKERPFLQSSLIDSGLSFLYHSDICDGTEITMLDPVKILSERGIEIFTSEVRGEIERLQLRYKCEITLWNYISKMRLAFNID